MKRTENPKESYKIKQITTKAAEILKDFDTVENALLFGSFAAGNAHAMSDVDIAVQTRKPLSVLALGDLLSRLETALDKKVDLVTLNDLPSNRPLLAYAIYQNHHPLFVRNTDAYLRFKEEALHRYMDFKPVMEMQNRSFKQRLKDAVAAKTQTA